MVLPPISSLTPFDNISQCSDDPKPKNKGIVRTTIINGFTYITTLVLLFMYSGMTCYEEKDRDWWIVRFFVVKDLNALLTVRLFHLLYATLFIILL